MVKEDITPIFATKNLDEVPKLDFANCSSYMDMDQFRGLFSGTTVSPCLPPCFETQTISAITSFGKADSFLSRIIIAFDRRVMTDRITVDKLELMESLNFFGSNLGLWPGLGIFQIVEWLLENILCKIDVSKFMEITVN